MEVGQRNFPYGRSLTDQLTEHPNSAVEVIERAIRTVSELPFLLEALAADHTLTPEQRVEYKDNIVGALGRLTSTTLDTGSLIEATAYNEHATMHQSNKRPISNG